MHAVRAPHRFAVSRLTCGDLVRTARYVDLLAMRGTLHTAQKSLIDTCKKHADLKVPQYVEMSKVSRTRQGANVSASKSSERVRSLQENAWKLTEGPSHTRKD